MQPAHAQPLALGYETIRPDPANIRARLARAILVIGLAVLFRSLIIFQERWLLFRTRSITGSLLNGFWAAALLGQLAFCAAGWFLFGFDSRWNRRAGVWRTLPRIVLVASVAAIVPIAFMLFAHPAGLAVRYRILSFTQVITSVAFAWLMLQVSALLWRAAHKSSLAISALWMAALSLQWTAIYLSSKLATSPGSRLEIYLAYRTTTRVYEVVLLTLGACIVVGASILKNPANHLETG